MFTQKKIMTVGVLVFVTAIINLASALNAKADPTSCAMYTNTGLGYEAKQKCESEKVKCVKIMAESKYKNEQDPTVLWNKDNWECKSSYRYIESYTEYAPDCPSVNDVFAACLADLKELSELPQE